MPKWEDMTESERVAFIAASADRRHAREYEDAKALMGVDGPKWEDLTETQRQTIRNENKRYSAEMDKIGAAIAKGST